MRVCPSACHASKEHLSVSMTTLMSYALVRDEVATYLKTRELIEERNVIVELAIHKFVEGSLVDTVFRARMENERDQSILCIPLTTSNE